MECLVWLLAAPIIYLVVGAAVVATLDRDQAFQRFVREQNTSERAMLFWPIAAIAILSGRKNADSEKGF
jgi:hypothetical protein